MSEDSSNRVRKNQYFEKREKLYKKLYNKTTIKNTF